MKRIICILVCLAIFSITSVAEAEVSSPCVDRNFECMLILGIGINLGGLNDGVAYTAFRIHYLERVPLALEVNAFLPFGVGANLLFYLYHDSRIAVHFIDFGIFYSWQGEMSARWLPRKFDLVVGTGIEIRVLPHLMITLDWRVFLANPPEILPRYADWGLKAYRESARGTPWVGLVYLF